MRTALRDLVGTLLVAVLLALAIRTVAIETFVVSGTSMLPTFLNGEHVLVNKLAYRFGPPRDGQIIIFLPPIPDASEDFIKRVVATAGQTISIRNDHLYVDGKNVPEPYIEYQEPASYDFAAAHPLKVPKGDVFVLGDNRPISFDSRYFPAHFVPDSRIVGQVVLAFWPPSRFGRVGQPEPGSVGYRA